MITVDPDEGGVVEVVSPTVSITVDGDSAAVEIATTATVVVETTAVEIVSIPEPTSIVTVISPPVGVITIVDAPPVEILISEGRGPTGDVSTVPGPPGADSIVPGPRGFDSVVPGPRGLQGIKGDPGAGGSDMPLVYEQPNPSAMWHIVHGRGTNPTVNLVRADGVTIGGFGIIYPDHNTVDIYPGLIAGEATLTF